MSMTVAPTQPAPNVVDVATAPLDQVREHLRHRPDASASPEVIQQQAPAPGGSSDLAGLVAQVTAPHADQAQTPPPQADPAAPPSPADPAASNDAATAEATPPERPAARRDRQPPATLEDAHRELASAYGNMQQLQELRRQEQAVVRQAQETQQRWEAHERQQAARQQQQERETYLQNVAALGLDPVQTQQAIDAFDKQRDVQQHAIDQQSYQSYLNDYHAGVQQTVQQLEELRTLAAREALPQTLRGFGEYAADRFNVPPDEVASFLATPNMKQVYALYQKPEHLAIIGEVVAATVEWLGTRREAGTARNAQAARQAGTYRTEMPGGTGGGPGVAEAINKMSDAQFRTLQQQMRAQQLG